MAGGSPWDDQMRLILSALPQAEFIAALVKKENTWVLASSWPSQGARNHQGSHPLPDASVLDFAASKNSPTYLPQGEEGSEWCLIDARSTLFLPFTQEQDPLVFYVVGPTVDAFTERGIRKAYDALVSPPDKRPIRVVIDTDTKNDIDDQFALVYALLSPNELQVESIYAAPFHNPQSSGPQNGMEQSYEEILRLLDRLNRSAKDFVHQGATQFLAGQNTPSHSPAALDLVERALQASVDDPLHVVGIGAATNIASALLIEPRIIEHIVVLWLGGHAYHWPHTREFNLRQDIHAARLLFECGVSLIHIPCWGVTSHLVTTVAEVEKYVLGCGPVGKYLAGIFTEKVGPQEGLSKVLWDIAPIAHLINEEWVETELRPSPTITDQLTWCIEPSTKDAQRHLIRYAWDVDRDEIFRDFFRKLK